MQESKNVTSAGTPSVNGTSEAMKFKFNTVGREDAAETVFKPQVDSGFALRRTLTILGLIVLFVIGSFISWDRAGRPNPFAESNHQKFEVPEHNVPQ